MRKSLLLAVSLSIAALFVAPLAFAATSVIPVFGGGTATSSFTQGWVYSNGTTSALGASTSPTVNYITATSTTATSTFAHGIQAPCFATSAGGACISGGGSGTVTSVATNNGVSGGTITTSGTISLDTTYGASWTASTTFQKVVNLANASSTLTTHLGATWFPAITASRLLAVDNNNQLIASSTLGANLVLVPANAILAGNASGAIIASSTIGSNLIPVPANAVLAGNASGQIIATSSISFGNIIYTKHYLTLSYGTSTAWTGTTTLPAFTIPAAMTLNSAQCLPTPAGTTFDAQLQYGTAPTYPTLIRYASTSPTQNTWSFSANNTPSSGASSTISFGNASTTLTGATCTLILTSTTVGT
jgi:hypothetical protein